MLHGFPSKSQSLLMYEYIESPFPQRLEGPSNSRRVPAGGEGQPLQRKLTPNTGPISLRPYIDALIVLSLGRRYQMEVLA